MNKIYIIVYSTLKSSKVGVGTFTTKAISPEEAIGIAYKVLLREHKPSEFFINDKDLVAIPEDTKLEFIGGVDTFNV